jgi:hypothetical protein
MQPGSPVRLRARTKMLVGDEGLLLRLGERTAKIVPYDDSVTAFVQIVARGGTEREFREQFVASRGELAWERAHEWLRKLDRGGFLERLDIEHELDPADVQRFSRLLDFFSEFETPQQSRFEPLRRLRERRVGILGIGGQGSWVAYCLACCAIGGFRLIDADIVEPSNLNRSILYTEYDIGRPKVESAKDAILRFAPRTDVDIRPERVVGTEQLVELLDGLDLVVLAADQPTWLIRHWATCAAIEVGVPIVPASGIRVGPFFIPGESACPMCEWALIVERLPRATDILAAAQALPRRSPGALGPFAALKAGLLVLDAFNYLSGHSRPLTLGAVWEMHPDLSSRLTAIPRHLRCPACGGDDRRFDPPLTHET